MGRISSVYGTPAQVLFQGTHKQSSQIQLVRDDSKNTRNKAKRQSGQRKMARSKTREMNTRSLHRESIQDAQTNIRKEKEKTKEKQRVIFSV
jgi:hypothetical protein